MGSSLLRSLFFRKLAPPRPHIARNGGLRLDSGLIYGSSNAGIA